jgi:GTP-sensing pleiotropic transcriptional regulator CodY
MLVAEAFLTTVVVTVFGSLDENSPLITLAQLLHELIDCIAIVVPVARSLLGLFHQSSLPKSQVKNRISKIVSGKV